MVNKLHSYVSRSPEISSESSVSPKKDDSDDVQILVGSKDDRLCIKPSLINIRWNQRVIPTWNGQGKHRIVVSPLPQYPYVLSETSFVLDGRRKSREFISIGTNEKSSFSIACADHSPSRVVVQVNGEEENENQSSCVRDNRSEGSSFEDTEEEVCNEKVASIQDSDCRRKNEANECEEAKDAQISEVVQKVPKKSVKKKIKKIKNEKVVSKLDQMEAKKANQIDANKVLNFVSENGFAHKQIVIELGKTFELKTYSKKAADLTERKIDLRDKVEGSFHDEYLLKPTDAISIKIPKEGDYILTDIKTKKHCNIIVKSKVVTPEKEIEAQQAMELLLKEEAKLTMQNKNRKSKDKKRKSKKNTPTNIATQFSTSSNTEPADSPVNEVDEWEWPKNETALKSSDSVEIAKKIRISPKEKFSKELLEKQDWAMAMALQEEEKKIAEMELANRSKAIEESLPWVMSIKSHRKNKVAATSASSSIAPMATVPMTQLKADSELIQTNKVSQSNVGKGKIIKASDSKAVPKFEVSLKSFKNKVHSFSPKLNRAASQPLVSAPKVNSSPKSAQKELPKSKFLSEKSKNEPAVALSPKIDTEKNKAKKMFIEESYSSKQCKESEKLPFLNGNCDNIIFGEFSAEICQESKPDCFKIEADEVSINKNESIERDKKDLSCDSSHVSSPISEDALSNDEQSDQHLSKRWDEFKTKEKLGFDVRPDGMRAAIVYFVPKANTA